MWGQPWASAGSAAGGTPVILTVPFQSLLTFMLCDPKYGEKEHLQFSLVSSRPRTLPCSRMFCILALHCYGLLVVACYCRLCERFLLVCLSAGLFCDPTGLDLRREIVRRRSAGQLKRLGFVRTYSQYYWSKANQLVSSVYSNGRSYIVPGFFDSSVRGLEHRISDATLPLISAMQAKSIGVLATLDNKVSVKWNQSPFW